MTYLQLNSSEIIGQSLYFMSVAHLWFIFKDDEDMLVCFSYISEEHIYASLKSICLKHGSGERIKGQEGDEPFYAFKIPSPNVSDCYQELKRHSVP